MKILITGGLGTIGSALTSRLFKDGHDITIYDNQEIGSISNLKLYLNANEITKIKLECNDITDSIHLLNIIDQVDLVFHLAATLGTLNVVEQPSRMLTVNGMATHNIIDHCVAQSKPIVLMSTSMVYGQNPKEKVDEEDSLFVGGNTKVGLWWYAISKLFDEAYANAVMLENPNAKILIVRPFNVIAPVQTAVVGFVFPRFFQNALQGKPLQVYGDGSQRRTFTWAEDFVDCLVGLVETDYWRDTVNIGGTESTSILSLAEKIIKKTESKSKINFVDPKDLFKNHFVEIEQRVPDVTKLKNIIGKCPSSSLEKMMERFHQYYAGSSDKINR